jgi:hypothetical protein
MTKQSSTTKKVEEAPPVLFLPKIWIRLVLSTQDDTFWLLYDTECLAPAARFGQQASYEQ